MFGMGTGGTPPLWSPGNNATSGVGSRQLCLSSKELCCRPCEELRCNSSGRVLSSAHSRKSVFCFSKVGGIRFGRRPNQGVSPRKVKHPGFLLQLLLQGVSKEYGQASRKISTGRLNTLPHLDRQPINQIISLVPSVCFKQRGWLILRGASHLDAFSGYPVRT